MWPHNFHFEFDERGGQAAGTEPPVPGTGEGGYDDGQGSTPPGDNTVPPAQDHGPVPYSRFKEVNDQRRAFEQQLQPIVALEQSGYGADDLHRLVAWEQEYLQDPSGTWLRQAQEIPNLPESVKQAIASIGEDAAKGNPPADGGPPALGDGDLEQGGEPPEWARPLISDYETRQQREESEAHRAIVDAMLNAWDETDTQLGIETPQETKLTYIQAASSQEGTPAEIFVRAHSSYMKLREQVLSSEIRSPQTGAVPRSVPGSGGSPPGGEPVQPRTLREATKQAAAAEAAGRLHLSEAG